MDFLGSERSTIIIFLLFIILPLGIVAVVIDRPKWDEETWKRELESFQEKYHPHHSFGENRPIQELIECALNTPKKFPSCSEGESSDITRRALTNEILLRKQFKSYNEDCNSAETTESELVVNPPKWQNGLPNYSSYFIWQEKVVNSKLHFCDPHVFLRCSTEKKCVCLSGSIRHENVCVYSHGSPCTGFEHFSFGGGDLANPVQRYFDPLLEKRGVRRFGEVTTPRCMSRDDTCIGDFQISYHRDRSYCVERYFFQRSESTRLDVVRYFQKLIPLLFGEACNFQDHNRLFTSTKEEDENHAVRTKTLDDFQYGRVNFCDLEKFMTCGPSEKCECMAPSSRKDNKCVLPRRLDKCIIDAEMEPILMNKSLVPRAREKLMIGFANSTVTACEGKMICHSDMMEIHCTCPPGKTGQDCRNKRMENMSMAQSLNHFILLVSVAVLFVVSIY